MIDKNGIVIIIYISQFRDKLEINYSCHMQGWEIGDDADSRKITNKIFKFHKSTRKLSQRGTGHN